MMKISIIIPLYNGAFLVKRCLDSVYNQIGDYSLEAIVIDDGSTDNSVEIVRNYPKEVKLLQQTNQGPAAARNSGIEVATGKYLAFLDADDYWQPNFLQETVTFLEEHNDAIAVSVGQIHKIPGKSDSISPKILETKPSQYGSCLLLDDFYKFWSEQNHVCTGSVLMRTNIVKETGGQRTELRITEDLEFWAYLATFGAWGFIPKILFISDGGEVTRQAGWIEKNRKRWASAPTVEEWESRIVTRLTHEIIDSYRLSTGRIVRNLIYSMMLSGRISLARATALKNETNLPVDKISRIITIVARNKMLFYLFSKALLIREQRRKV